MDRLTQRDIIPTATKTRHLGNNIQVGSVIQTSFSIAANTGKVISMPNVTSPYRNLTSQDFTLYEGAVSDANRIPNGANVTASNYQIIGPWNDLASTDGNNTQTKIYIGNVSTSSGSYSGSIPSGSEDGSYRQNTLPHWITNGTTIPIGNGGANPFLDGLYTAGIRFTNVTIPNSVTINAAKITITISNSDSLTSITKIYGIAEDNTASFSSDPTGRPRTTANIGWTLGSVTANTAYDTPDISTVVQEIINRAGWVSGNAMGFVIPDNGSSDSNNHLFFAYDFSPPKPTATLTVTYTTPGVSKTVIVKYRPRYIT